MTYLKWIGYVFLKFACFSMLTLSVFASSLSPQNTENNISATYTVLVDQSEKRLEVSAVFENVQNEKVWLGFSNSNFHAEYTGSDLSTRVYDLIETTEAVDIDLHESNDDLKLYEVTLNGHSRFSIRYVFDPKKVPYDNHFTELTQTTLHIPGRDFLIRVFTDHTEIEKNINFSAVKRHTITLKNLSSDWQIVTTYDQPDENTVTIDDREGNEILLSAGNYKTTAISSRDSRIRVSLDPGLKIDTSYLITDVEKILKAYYAIYNDIPAFDILMVVNQNPTSIKGWNRSFRGQAQKQNIVNTIGWGDEYSKEEIKGLTLSLLAHQIHHIWLSHGFIKTENWAWCWEGMTEYISEKILHTLKMVPDKHFIRQMEQRYINYTNNPVKDQKSLVEISLSKKPTPQEYDLIYDKGTIVSYLIDLELQRKNETLEGLLHDLYYQFAKEDIPVGNRTVIDFINEKLGNKEITENYVLGKTTIPQDSFEFDWLYYWRVGEVYLATLPIHYIIISAFTVLTLVLSLCWIFLRHIRNPAE